MNARYSNSVDFGATNQRCMQAFPSLLARWLPSGRCIWREWVALNPTRHDRHLGSFKIGMGNGLWADFATGDSGGDHGMSFDFSAIRHGKAGVPSRQYVYRDKDGEPVLIANRYDKPGGGKFFLPYDTLRKEWKAPNPRPIFNLDKIMAADPATPVILVEGEKCADTLSGLGYLCTTTFGGCNGFRKTGLSPLQNLIVYIWPDNDEPEKPMQRKWLNPYIIYMT